MVVDMLYRNQSYPVQIPIILFNGLYPILKVYYNGKLNQHPKDSLTNLNMIHNLPQLNNKLLNE